MNLAVEFLSSFAQALSALSLYPEGHTSRERALDSAFEKLSELLSQEPNPRYSFLEDEVIYLDTALREMRHWDWSHRFSAIGMQRMEFDRTVTRDELERFLDETLSRLSLRPIDTCEGTHFRPSGIRWGEIGIRGEDGFEDTEIETATLALSLGDEADAVRWLHQEVTSGRNLPLVEAEAVVRGLSVAMHGDQQAILPLLRLREFDEYTTTHSLNVCVLTMGLAEYLGLGARDVRAFGTSGLLHDLGKVRIPLDVLNKTGKLDPQERAVMNAHPVEGARIIITSEPDLDMAAVVAYEHHMMLNGGGYPGFHYKRECHDASKLVHVCDVYDALRTKRPYRDAWPSEKVLAYIEERSGTEFDGPTAHAFAAMIRGRETKMMALTEDDLPDPSPDPSSELT